MRRSDNFIEVLKAIDEAKQNIRSLKKGAKNPHFKNDYADLDEVLDVLKRPLHSQSISLNQFPDEVNGKFVLTTVLTHLKTGAFIETDFPLLLEKNTAQGQGSALTYARRYSLTSIFGLHEFDDDGHEASNPIVSKMPVPTVSSLMAKYIALHKVDKMAESNELMTIYNGAKDMANIQNSETYINSRFKAVFGDKRTEKETT